MNISRSPLMWLVSYASIGAGVSSTMAASAQTEAALVDYGLVANVTHEAKTVALTAGTGEPLAIFADIQTFNGAETANARATYRDEHSFEVFVEEERSYDEEVEHEEERIGYMVFTEGLVVDKSGAIVGEVGRVSVDQSGPDEWHTQDLMRSYTDPVAIVMPNSHDGSQPVHGRVRAVSFSSFEYQLEEWGYNDGEHKEEVVVYLVVEKGVHLLSGQRLLQATSMSTNHDFASASFLQGHHEMPVVLAQSQTANGSQEIITRINEIGTERVDVRLQETEASAGTHENETVALVSLSKDIVGCGPATDEDRDGLSNCLEARLGTNWAEDDTDGDGYTDYEELNIYAFDPENNNFKFNPRIADLPVVHIEMLAPPALGLITETASGSENQVQIETSTGSSDTSGWSSGGASVYGTEFSTTFGTEVSAGFEAGILGGSVTVSQEWTTTSYTEETYTWSKEAMSTKEVGYSEAVNTIDSESETITGGVISVPVKICNAGYVAFDLEYFAISAYRINPWTQTIQSAVGNMDFDTSFNHFPAHAFAPQQCSEPMVFLNDRLDVNTIEDLIYNSFGLQTGVVGLAVKPDGQSGTQSLTTVFARTASVMFDYSGPDAQFLSETRQVATAIGGETRITALFALEDIMRMDLELDSSGRLQRARTVANDPEIEGYWSLMHIHDDGVQDPQVDVYNRDDDYDLRTLEIKSGDTLRFVYVVDQDDDGLTDRTESLLGTDPLAVDTDHDGYTDYFEYKFFLTDPLDSESPKTFPGNELGADRQFIAKRDVYLDEIDSRIEAFCLEHGYYFSLISAIEVYDNAELPEIEFGEDEVFVSILNIQCGR